MYTLLFSLQVAASAIGPMIAAIVFAATGNTWHLGTLQRVMLVGMGVAIAPVLVLLCFDDDKTLGVESDAHQPLLDQGSKGICVACQHSLGYVTGLIV